MNSTDQKTKPQTALPIGATDTHMHLYSPAHQGQSGGPPPPEDFAGLKAYRDMQKQLSLSRVVVVQPNAYQRDNSCMLEALDQLGDSGRGIVVVTPDTPEEELAAMHARNARGARIMQLPGGVVGLANLLEVNVRIAPFGWHCIVQFDGREMLQHKPLLKKIPGPYIIDHIGKYLSPTKPSDPEFTALLELVDRGNCYVKIAACYESSHTGAPEFADTAALSRKLIEHAPERILWGSNWPHVSQPVSGRPDDSELLDTVCGWIPDSAMQQIFVENPARLYGFQNG